MSTFNARYSRNYYDEDTYYGYEEPQEESYAYHNRSSYQSEYYYKEEENYYMDPAQYSYDQPYLQQQRNPYEENAYRKDMYAKILAKMDGMIQEIKEDTNRIREGTKQIVESARWMETSVEHQHESENEETDAEDKSDFLEEDNDFEKEASATFTTDCPPFKSYLQDDMTPEPEYEESNSNPEHEEAEDSDLELEELPSAHTISEQDARALFEFVLAGQSDLDEDIMMMIEKDLAEACTNKRTDAEFIFALGKIRLKVERITTNEEPQPEANVQIDIEQKSEGEREPLTLIDTCIDDRVPTEVPFEKETTEGDKDPLPDQEDPPSICTKSDFEQPMHIDMIMPSYIQSCPYFTENSDTYRLPNIQEFMVPCREASAPNYETTRSLPLASRTKEPKRKRGDPRTKEGAEHRRARKKNRDMGYYSRKDELRRKDDPRRLENMRNQTKGRGNPSCTPYKKKAILPLV